MQEFPKLERKFFYKDNAHFNVDGKRIIGYASVFDIVDSHNDIVKRGTFLESVEYHKSNEHVIKFLWQHNPLQPIGVINELYEDEKGLVVVATINTEIQKGKEVISLIKQGAINGLSIGFTVEDYSYNEQNIRFIKKANLWEISIVTFPANANAQISGFTTSEAKSLSEPLLEQNFTKAFHVIKSLNNSL